MKGEYRHTIDAKGRLAMPAKLRDELGEHFTVTKGLDGCLFVYPDAEWASLEARIQRYYCANAFDAQLDAQGRILIPGNLREFACLEKDVTVVGLLDHAEIWDTEKWNEYNGSIDAESISADMEGIDF